MFLLNSSQIENSFRQMLCKKNINIYFVRSLYIWSGVLDVDISSSDRTIYVLSASYPTVYCKVYTVQFAIQMFYKIQLYVQRKLENQQITHLFGLPEKLKKFRSARRTNREIGEIIRTVQYI